MASTGKAPQLPKPQIDWERIELDYRAGVKSLREIAEGSGTSHVNIAKRAKAQGWVRDLTKKIEAKANELVNRSLVNTPVNKASPAAEKATVEAVASTQASVRLAHRADIERTRRLCMGLMQELEQQSTAPELHKEVLALLKKADKAELSAAERAKLSEAANKAGSLGARSSTLRSLSESLKVLIALERQAFGIREELDDSSSAAAQAGMRALTDAERAVRLAEALKGSHGALTALLGAKG